MDDPKKTIKNDITKIPTHSVGDVAHTLARAGLAALPYYGGSAAELFNAIIIPPLTKRKDEWVQSIGIGLMEVERKIDDFSLDNLSKNEDFITIVMHATSVAIRNHQEEKLRALRNAVINSSLPNNALDEDLQIMFINIIDFLTPSHLLVLSRVNDPLMHGGKPLTDWSRVSVRISEKFPEFIGKENFLNQIISDLHSYGLIQKDSSKMNLFDGEFMLSSKTILGTQFVAFITSN
jgi:hypothetical protein